VLVDSPDAPACRSRDAPPEDSPEDGVELEGVAEVSAGAWFAADPAVDDSVEAELVAGAAEAASADAGDAEPLDADGETRSASPEPAGRA
jgi:hypothetical protein